MAAAGTGAPPAAQAPLITLFPREVSQEGRYMFLGLETDGASTTAYACYSPTGTLLYRIVRKGWFVEKIKVFDGEGKQIAVMEKSVLSLAKWKIMDMGGRLLAKTATVPGLAKYGAQLFLPGRSKPAMMIAPCGDLRSLQLWQCAPGGSINRDEGRDYCEAAYGANVLLGFVSALMQSTTYHVLLEPGADALLAACMIAVADELMAWDSVAWVS